MAGAENYAAVELIDKHDGAGLCASIPRARPDSYRYKLFN